MKKICTRAHRLRLGSGSYVGPCPKDQIGACRCSRQIDVIHAIPAIAVAAREVGVARYSQCASSLGPGCGQVFYSYTDDQDDRLTAELIRAVGCTPVRGQDL